jgi:effector-binding domain-containing protein
MEFKIVKVESMQGLSITDNCTPMGLPDKYDELYTELREIIKKQGLDNSGPAFGIYHSFTKENVKVEAGFVIDGTPKEQGRAKTIQTYGGNAICARHVGPYRGLGNAWGEFNKWVKENNYRAAGNCYELYVNDPGNEKDDSKLITDLYLPIED